MKQVCFLGSSHVGCMKLGVEAAKAAGKLDDVAVQVFGTAGEKLRNTSVEDGLIRGLERRVQLDFKWTSGGNARVKLDKFEELYFFAGLPPTTIDGYLSVDPITRQLDMPPLTDQMVARVFDSIRAMWHIQLAEKIARERPHLKVRFVGRPFEAETSPNARQILKRLRAWDQGFATRVDKVRAAIARQCAKTELENFEYVRPPAALLEKHGLFTQAEFTRGSLRMAEDKIAHPKDDYSHMNAEYGEAMVLHLLKPAA